MLLMGSVQLSAQQLTVVPDESSLWIEGFSNVNQFSCVAKEYETNVNQDRRIEEADPSEIEVEVEIFVESFDCGRSKMNRDLREALKADRHKAIQFRYLSTRQITYDNDSETYTLLVEGILTVAGIERHVEFEMTGKLINENIIQASGQTTLEMSNFDIEPPVALLGLIKVQDRLTVNFNLLAHYRYE